MKPVIITACICIFLFFRVSAQLNINGIYSTTAIVGWSAISTDSIKAKTFHFTYPVFACEPDTLYQQVLFSTRQRGDNIEEVYLNYGGFASITHVGDSLKWKNSTAMFDIDLVGPYLLMSNDKRTIRFNRDFGYDETRFSDKIIYSVPQWNLGLAYAEKDRNTLKCVDLESGELKWTAGVPSREDWADVKMLNDSVILVVAAGLHAIHVRNGLLWSLPYKTAVVNTGTLVYSPAKNNNIKKTSHRIPTSTEDNLLTQLASNILILRDQIFVSSKDHLLALDVNGKTIWKTDLSEYPVSKMLLLEMDAALLLVNFGVATHGKNFVTSGTPFILDINLGTGEIEDQHQLGEIRNLSDFMFSKNGLSFGGKKSILEVRGKGSEDVQSEIPLNVTAYGQFVEFIDGNRYYVLREGYYVPLNFIDDQLVYFLADNNKIYGLKGNTLLYEYHLSDLYRFDKKVGDRQILVGLTETVVTSRNFELLCSLKLAVRNVALGNKLYFIDKEQVHIVNLNDLR